MAYLYYLIGAYLYLIFLGAGLTYFILPLRLKDYALIFAPFVGYAFAMLMAWHAYQANLSGTDSYGWLILAASGIINSAAVWHRLRTTARMVCWSGKDTGLALLPSILALGLTSIPFALHPGGPTTMALGNNDIADYACMARFLKEFPRDSQIGFLGQFSGFQRLCDEIWFGPAAITSLFSTTLDTQCFRLQSLCINLFAILGTPFAYVFCREYLALKRWFSAGVACLYAAHPIILRIVYDGFHGQIMATSLVLGLVTIGLLGMKEPGWRGKVAFLPILIIFNWAVMLSYSFMIIFAIWMLTAAALMEGLWSRRVAEMGRAIAVIAASVLVTFALSPFRVGMLVRQLALAKIQAGYYLGFLYPDRVMGLLGTDMFASESRPISAQLVAVAVVAVLVSGGVIAWRSRARNLAFIAPPLLVIYGFSGYLFFSASPDALPFASYKAFKPIGVFLPVFFCVGWATLWHVLELAGRARIALLIPVMILAGWIELGTSSMLIERLRTNASVVTEEMAELGRVESDPSITSINIFSTELWPYLWHTYFLMKKPLYLGAAWYGRPRSLPNGDFDLHESSSDDILAVQPTQGAVYLNRRYQISPTLHRAHPVLEFGEGWWPRESTHCWTGATGSKYRIYVTIEAEAKQGQLRGLFFIPLAAGDQVGLTVNGSPVPVEHTTMELKTPVFTLNRGRNVLEFIHTANPGAPSAGEPRSLLAAWQEIVIDFAE